MGATGGRPRPRHRGPGRPQHDHCERGGRERPVRRRDDVTHLLPVWEAVAVAVVVDLGYFAFLDGSRRGQTVGKMTMGITVVDATTGGPLGAGRALLRRALFLATYFGLILFVLNALSPLWDPRRRAWHDKLARSSVVSRR
ncbi:MAG: RDD family protein [Acidimicrobiales bacterium]